MSSFRVLDVFRLAQRVGPVLVGEATAARIGIGTRLVLSSDPTQWVEVLAIDPPTSKFQDEGRLAVVVHPDLGDLLAPGELFSVVNTDPA